MHLGIKQIAFGWIDSSSDLHGQATNIDRATEKVR